MTLEGIIVGLIALGIGAAFCFQGFKWFLILLPIWGFLVGVAFGANVVFYIFNDGFFATTLAVVVALIMGVVFAVLSYLYYYFAVILLGGALGYALGVGFMDLFNITGILAFIVGIVVAAVFAYGFIRLAMPAVLAIWGTAIGGALAMVVGIVLILGRAPVSSLGSGPLGAPLADTDFPWLWIAIGIVLAVAGAFAQIRMLGTAVVAITKDRYQNPGMA